MTFNVVIISQSIAISLQFVFEFTAFNTGAEDEIVEWIFGEDKKINLINSESDSVFQTYLWAQN